MSRWHGRQGNGLPRSGRGAAALMRHTKRVEAEDRNARTPYDRRRAYRRQQLDGSFAALLQREAWNGSDDV